MFSKTKIALLAGWGFLLTLVLLCALLYLRQPPFLVSLVKAVDERFLDQFFILRGPQKPSGQVVIVDTTERSASRAPWTQAEVAAAIAHLYADGARVVGDSLSAEEQAHFLDQMFPELLILGEDNFLKRLPDAEWQPFLSQKSRLHEYASLWRMPLFDRSQQSVEEVVHASLAVKMFCAAHACDKLIFDCEGALSGMHLYQKEEPLKSLRFLPTNRQGKLLVNFLGYGGPWALDFGLPPDYFMPYYNFSELLSGHLPQGTFQNKYVLIGSSGSKNATIHTPFNRTFPSIEMHAVVLENMLLGQSLVDYGREVALWSFIALLTLGTLVVIVTLSNAWGFSLSTLALLLAGLYAGSYCGFVYLHAWIPVAYLMGALLCLFGCALLARHFFEGRKKRLLHTCFASSVSAKIMRKLHQDFDFLDGQKNKASVMFLDLSNFSFMAAKRPISQVVRALNEYVTPIGDIVRAHDGFVDKLTGSTVMACWGVPLSDQEHAEKACLCALEQQAVLKQLTETMQQQYGVLLMAKIGIATGEVGAAIMGSKVHPDYTVMGAPVDMAASLKAACRDYGISILIDERTYKQAQGAIVAKRIDKISVKGREHPVAIYELIGKREVMV